jgi:hypothetical protein
VVLPVSWRVNNQLPPVGGGSAATAPTAGAEADVVAGAGAEVAAGAGAGVVSVPDARCWQQAATDAISASAEM